VVNFTFESICLLLTDVFQYHLCKSSAKLDLFGKSNNESCHLFASLIGAYLQPLAFTQLNATTVSKQVTWLVSMTDE
jgi:hypothetical protein